MSGWYWIFPDDQLPAIGSGMRRVAMRDDMDDYTVTLTDAAGVSQQRIRLDVWESIPHIEDSGQPLAEVLTILRNADTRPVREEKRKRS